MCVCMRERKGPEGVKEATSSGKQNKCLWKEAHAHDGRKQKTTKTNVQLGTVVSQVQSR